MGFGWLGGFVLVKVMGRISLQSNPKWPHNWLELQWCANCDPATSTDLDVSICCEAGLIVSWPLFANGVVKIFKAKDFLKKSEVLQHAAKMLLFFFPVLLKDKHKNYMLVHVEIEKCRRCPARDPATQKIEFCFSCIYCHFSHWKELFLGNFDRGELVGLNIDLNYHLKRKLRKIPYHRESFLHLWAWDRTGFNESLTCDSIPPKIVNFPSTSPLFRERARYHVRLFNCVENLVLTTVGLQVNGILLASIPCQVILQQLR